MAEIVVLDDGSALAALRLPRRFRRHRLHQRGATLSDRLLSHLRRCSRVDHVTLELLGVLEEQARVRTHQAVRSDQKCLAGAAHSGVLPLLAHGHQVVDLGDRELQGQNAFDASLGPDRRQHPRGGFVGGLVGAEVGDADVVDGVGRHRLLVGLAQFAFAEGAGEDVGAEIGALVGAVDDVAAGIEQQCVLELEAPHDLPEVVVVPGVGGRPCAAVAGVVEFDRLVPVVEGSGVVRLQVFLGVGARQYRGDVDGVAGLFLLRLLEVVAVVVDDRLPLRRIDRGVVELVESVGECLDCFRGRRAAGVDDQGILEVGELRLQLPRL